MTDPRTRPIAVPVAARAAAGTDGEVLTHADGVELLGEVPGSGYRRPPALTRRGDGQVVTLTPLLYTVLAAVDGRRTVGEVAEAVGAATGRLVRPDDVRQLAERSLRPLGLLRLADGSQPRVEKANPLLALRFRRAVTDPARTRRLTTPFAVLFSPLVVVPVVLAFGAVSHWVLFHEGLAAAAAQAFAVPSLFLAVVALTVLSAGFHEFGHAAAARYGGATPGAMGFGVHLFWPAFYTDVTDSYRLGRAGRVRTDLGGLYFNAIVVLLSFAVWWLSGWHAVLLLVATQILQMVRQLAPLLRFDGYHVLADVTGVPDLYQRIGPVLSGLLPGRWRQPEATALKPWARAVVILWVLLVVPLMSVSLLLMVVALPRLLATAWSGVQRQASLLGAAFEDGDILGVLARGLGIVALVIPLLGLALVLGRVLVRAVAGVRRRTAGRPLVRAVAVAVAAAVLAGLVWAWWPEGDRYRPIRSYEGGTVLDAVPAASSGELGAAEGDLGQALTIWPDEGPLPTADSPALALVLTPAAQSSAEGPTAEDPVAGDPPVEDSAAEDPAPEGSAGEDPGPASAGAAVDAPTWVIPVDRPLPPGDGDNQALAVNTEDGSVRYDVSFSFVWVEDDIASNRNEAYALAACTGCRTVAVAFQVVVLLGSVDVVVPENVAVAVNYACIDCVTYALATQLVVSVPGPLDGEAARELAAIWDELRQFGEQIEGAPLSELQGRLKRFEERFLGVVQRSATEAPPVAGDAAPTDPGAGSAGETESAGGGTSTPDTDEPAPAEETGTAPQPALSTASATPEPVPSTTAEEEDATGSPAAEPTATAPAGGAAPAEPTPTTAGATD
ncbi:hypothetical protein ACI782_05525 [Geodermatophilus sp. SYSU D00703]